MHKFNPHKDGYDMDALVSALPELADHIITAPNGRKSINFSDPISVKLLNRSLLKYHYGIEYWDIPDGYLCPPIPGRMDYLLAVADQLNDRKNRFEDASVRALDVGTGANLIYPILGASHLKWQWVASDIEMQSIKHAKSLINENPNLKNTIFVRHQNQASRIFKDIIQEGEYFDVTMCNPPFHSSKKEAMKGSERKNKNLQRNKNKRHSNVQGGSHQTLNFAGQSNELWCDGGERRFVSDMISESEHYRSQVGLFTCLISKKENVAPLLKQLKHLGAQAKVVEMAQGSKISRCIVWSFSSIK